MQKTTVNVPRMSKMSPHDPRTYEVNFNPDSQIDHIKAAKCQTSTKYPAAVTLGKFDKQPGRDRNLEFDERIKNIQLENTK